MTNTEFWRSISAIISNGFDKDGIIKLEDYAEQFFNKQLLFKRYSPSEQHGCATGGSFHVVASILAGAETPANQITAPEGSFKRECQRAEAQAAVIEQWAKTACCWVDSVDKAFEQTFGEQLTEGGEAHVYENGNTIIKRISLDYYILPELDLDRITLHNTLFPETRLVVLGFGRTSDMHDENIIKSRQGNIFVIDCDIRINTPNLKCDGVRKLSNEVEFTV